MEMIKKIFQIFEISGKAMLGLFSVGMFIACVFIVTLNITGVESELPNSVVDVYKWSLTLFAASKTAVKLLKPKGAK